MQNHNLHENLAGLKKKDLEAEIRAYVEHKYRRNLDYVEQHIGHNKETWNYELEKFMNDLGDKSFKGVKQFHVNELKKFKIGDCGIENTGGHWIALMKIGKEQFLMYDSFGRKCDELRKNCKNIIDTEYDAEQRIDEMNCGQRCCAWLMLKLINEVPLRWLIYI